MFISISVYICEIKNVKINWKFFIITLEKSAKIYLNNFKNTFDIYLLINEFIYEI